MSGNNTEDFVVLSSSNAWRATPWDYSSMRSILLRNDATGKLLFGYGQTIYAVIDCRFEVLHPGILQLEYLPSPPVQRFAGFEPQEQTRMKQVHYRLIPGFVSFVEGVVSHHYQFEWTLEVDRSPYPDGLVVPVEIPLVFYGHEVIQRPSES